MCMVSIRNILPFRDVHVQKKSLHCVKNSFIKNLVLQKYTVHCILVGYKLHVVIVHCIVLHLHEGQQALLTPSNSSRIKSASPLHQNGPFSFNLYRTNTCILQQFQQLFTEAAPGHGIGGCDQKRGLSPPASCSLSMHILMCNLPL